MHEPLKELHWGWNVSTQEMGEGLFLIAALRAMTICLCEGTFGEMRFNSLFQIKGDAPNDLKPLLDRSAFGHVRPKIRKRTQVIPGPGIIFIPVFGREA